MWISERFHAESATALKCCTDLTQTTRPHSVRQEEGVMIDRDSFSLRENECLPRALVRTGSVKGSEVTNNADT